MRLGLVIQLIRLGFLNDADQVGRVSQVSVMQDKFDCQPGSDRDDRTSSIKAWLRRLMHGQRSPYSAQFCEVGSILARDTCNESGF